MRSFAICAAWMGLSAAVVSSQAASKVANVPGWPIAQPGAVAIVGIEWQRIVHSSLGDLIAKQIKDAKLPAIGGIDLMNDIDRVVISSPGAKPGSKQNQPPTLFIAVGRFNK